MNSPKRPLQSSKCSPSAPNPIAKVESENCIVRQCSLANPQHSSRPASPNRRHSSFDSGARGYTSYMAPERSICLIDLGAGASTFELSLASFVSKDSGGALATSTSTSFESSRTFKTLREQL